MIWSLSSITWTVDPIIFDLDLGFFNYQLRWYPLMFILGFAIGYKIMSVIYKRENMSQDSLADLFLCCFLGTLIGARLGHCLFYDPEYYLANPIEILKTWKGGLASHGGTIGVIIGVMWYSHKYKLANLWVLDRLCIAVAPVAALIRMGNLFNHEIYGHPTALPWGVKFIRNISAWQHGADPIFTLPSHPTQVYEALAYLAVFAFVLWLYFKANAGKHNGLIFGAFLIGIFGFRFIIEFMKNVQEEFEQTMLLDMGQLLSIPFIVVGVWLVRRALKKKNQGLEETGNRL